MTSQKWNLSWTEPGRNGSPSSAEIFYSPEHKRNKNFLLGGRGGGAVPEAIYNLYWSLKLCYEKYVKNSDPTSS